MSNPIGNIGFVITIAKGIVRDRKSRRSVLFFVLLVAMLMAFVGAVLLNEWLTPNPIYFLVYWGICIWLTFLSILLAVHDLLMLRQETHREQQRLKAQVFGMKDDEGQQ